MSKNPVQHSRCKHIDIKLHFVRDQVAEKEIQLEYIATEEQKADILTKALNQPMFEKLRRKLGVTKFELRGGGCWKLIQTLNKFRLSDCFN